MGWTNLSFHPLGVLKAGEFEKLLHLPLKMISPADRKKIYREV